MVHHYIGIGCVLAALSLTTLGAWLTLGAVGLFAVAVVWAVTGAMLVDRDRLND